LGGWGGGPKAPDSRYNGKQQDGTTCTSSRANDVLLRQVIMVLEQLVSLIIMSYSACVVGVL
jgi:hypothetical protein